MRLLSVIKMSQVFLFRARGLPFYNAVVKIKLGKDVGLVGDC